MIRWVGRSATHVGHVRSANEDALIERPEIGLWAVADGMGGHAAGDLASAWVVQALADLGSPSELSDRVDAVDAALNAVNTKILDYASDVLQGRTMGSTVAVLLIQGAAGVCLWAGDSRLYRCRDGRMAQISADHNCAADLREQGWPEEAIAHQPKNIITRAVGVATDLFLDATVFTVEPDDRFLLCSDGLTDDVSDLELNRLLLEPAHAGAASSPLKTPQPNPPESEFAAAPPVDAAQALMQTALAGRARDNISLIVVQSEAA